MNYFTHKQRRGIAYVATGALGVVAMQAGIHGAYLTSSIVATTGVAGLLIPSLFRNCSLYGQVMTHFLPTGREVWLTIDDGPTSENTLEILDVLSRYNVKATFFCIGRCIAEHPELAIAIHSAGHSVQNHSYSHSVSTFWATSRKRARAEINACNQLIKTVTGEAPFQFRAPVGLANPFLHEAIEESGLQLVGWSSSGFDGIISSHTSIIERIMRSIRPGSIILLHESPLKNMNFGARAKILEILLRRVCQAGYTFALPMLKKI